MLQQGGLASRVFPNKQEGGRAVCGEKNRGSSLHKSPYFDFCLACCTSLEYGGCEHVAVQLKKTAVVVRGCIWEISLVILSGCLIEQFREKISRKLNLT